MMRRSRISVRPNVKPTGRGPGASKDASAENVQPFQGPADSAVTEGSEVTAEELKTDPPVAELEQTNQETSQTSTHADQLEDAKCGENASSKSLNAQDSTGTSVTSGPQRRKRFTALPNLAKPRPSPASSRTPKSLAKSPVRPVTPNQPETSILNAEPSLQVPKPLQSPLIPGGPRPSGGSTQAESQPSPPVLQNDRETPKNGGLDNIVVPLTVQQGNVEITSPPDTVLVENENENPDCPVPPAVEEIVVQQDSNSGPTVGQSQVDLLRGKLKNLKSSSNTIKSLRTLNDPADMVRLAQAKKLRELLKKEMNKNKEDKKKPKMGLKERKAPKDHTKMTMRELIYYLPVSNPMKSFTEEEQKASETVLDDPTTPISSKTPAPPPAEEVEVAEDAEPEEDNERMEEVQPEDEEPLLVPRVKVAEDGSLIIDEESLTVQVLRAKGPNPAEDRDPIFERGSTTTYSSFRKGTYTKPWSNGETEMFFLAISMVGTDFSMIGQLFPHRARLEIKNKFKKEEKKNAWRIDKAFKEKRRLDLEFFKNLMEQILKDEGKKKNKNKELVKLAQAQKRVRRKVRAIRKEMDSSEDSDSDVVAGEKENEDLSNEGGSDGTPNRHRGRGVKTSRSIKRTNGEDLPDECENVTSDIQTQDDGLRESESSENISKSPAIKPAQLKGRPQRQIPNISRRWGDRRPQPKNNIQDGRTSGEDCKSLKVPSVSIQEKESSVFLDLEDLDEEPDLSSVQEQIFNKPTRSGRIPKLSQHVIQAAAEEEEDEDELSDLPTSSKVSGQGIKAPGRRAKTKPGPRLKQGMQRRGKSRLVTLLASGTEDDDDEEEREEAETCVLSQEDFPLNPEEENQAFVPMSLRPQAAVHSEVVETMEELDFSVNVPDIISSSHNALCCESACEQATLPAGPVPYEHQLDLLVDVIEFLDPEHMEVCKEINNEAAQTLLTIGNSAQIIQTSEIPYTSGNDVVVHEEIAHEEVITETVIMSDPSMSCDLEMKNDIEISSCESYIQETPAEDLPPSKESQPGPVYHDSQDSICTIIPPAKRGRFSKPKPNIGQRTRRAPQQQISSQYLTDSTIDPSLAEHDKNEAQVMQNVSGDLLDSSNIHPEVQQPDTASERREVPERMTKEDDNASVSSLKRKNEDEIREETLKEKEEISDSLLINSVSECQSPSNEDSKAVRRCRGPKPKPNLTLASRKKCTQTHPDTPSATTETTENSPRCTLTNIPEEDAVVSTESDVPQGVTLSIESTQPDESRVKTVVTLDENNRTSPDEVFGDSNVKHSQCDPEAVPEEPMFILSLTEIPHTLAEEVGLSKEPFPPTIVSESHSHGQSVNESEGDSHLLTEALVPVPEKEDQKEEDEGKSKAGILEAQEGTEDESHCVVEVLQSPVPKETGEHLEKKIKLPERTRRAKLQVKPIPVSRRNPKGIAKEDTATLTLKAPAPSPISKPGPSVILTSTTISHKEATVSPLEENVAEDCVQKGCSQGFIGNVELPVKETVELACGADSQSVTQITPVATSGPLTRPGRRPKGFLSFISTKSTQGPTTSHRGSKPGLQKPVVNTARLDRKQLAATSTNSGLKRPSPTPASTTEQNSEDEPTSVSKYFFSDIFTEVDELEDMD